MKRTANLGIFQYQPEIDGKEVFSINKALNENWDILDENFYNLSQQMSVQTQSIRESLNEILESRTSFYITETYFSDFAWYRVWSNGWIEQGNKINNPGMNSTVNVNFLRSYNNKCLVQLTPQTNGNWQNGGTTSAVNLTLTKFSYFIHTAGNDNKTNGLYWYAIGY